MTEIVSPTTSRSAFSSFTVGGKGSQGGLGLGLAKPADQDLYILLEAADTDHNHLDALPFFPVTAAPSDWGFFSQMGTQTHARGREKMPMFAFPDDKISRTFELGTDSWRVVSSILNPALCAACGVSRALFASAALRVLPKRCATRPSAHSCICCRVAGDLTFTVYSQARGVPDPNKSDDSTLKARRACECGYAMRCDGSDVVIRVLLLTMLFLASLAALAASACSGRPGRDHGGQLAVRQVRSQLGFPLSWPSFCVITQRVPMRYISA